MTTLGPNRIGERVTTHSRYRFVFVVAYYIDLLVLLLEVSLRRCYAKAHSLGHAGEDGWEGGDGGGGLVFA